MTASSNAVLKLARCCLLGAMILLTMFIGRASAGPVAYGICQSGCNALVVSCYAAAGFTFGTVTGGAGVPAAIVACNASLGACMAACVAAGFTPTP
jgi:citrate lyase alpha subunit